MIRRDTKTFDEFTAPYSSARPMTGQTAPFDLARRALTHAASKLNRVMMRDRNLRDIDIVCDIAQDLSVNAFSAKYKGGYVCGINLGLIYKIWSVVHLTNDISALAVHNRPQDHFDSLIDRYNRVSDPFYSVNTPKDALESDLWYYHTHSNEAMKEDVIATCICFVFLHEIGHILSEHFQLDQLSGGLFTEFGALSFDKFSYNSDSYLERFVKSCSRPIADCHALEFEADAFAVDLTLRLELFQANRDLGLPDVIADYSHAQAYEYGLVVFGSASLALLLVLQDQLKGMLGGSLSHPRPLVRLCHMHIILYNFSARGLFNCSPILDIQMKNFEHFRALDIPGKTLVDEYWNDRKLNSGFRYTYRRMLSNDARESNVSALIARSNRLHNGLAGSIPWRRELVVREQTRRHFDMRIASLTREFEDAARNNPDIDFV